MRLLILILSLWALVSAKPEMYREKEDFQFSRSSSDDGSKSGFYGAQRGNMGGNYEKAHNMDSLAQHQMSSLVRHVDGELGEGANTKTGSVFTAANSRGIYGSGNYDLSNLKGRNFEEGVSYGNSQSQSSLSSQNSEYNENSYSAANNARYSTSQLRAAGLNSAYRKTGLASQYAQFDNQQAENQYSGRSNYEYGGQEGSHYKYYSHGGSQAQNEYDQSNANLHSFSNYDGNTNSRLITTPVRLYVRPGTTIKLPVAAQTYDASQSSLVSDQNMVNSDAELLSNSGRRINVIKPLNNAKHYESSYSYRKEWEKHNTQPLTVVPTENPFPKNSELYEDAQLLQTAGQQYQSELDSTNAQSSSINSAYTSNVNSGYSSGYRANTKSAAGNRLQYQSQLQNSGASSTSDAYTLGTYNAASNLNDLTESINSKPKSYQSSYSYHKSWERRGDPYVIKPVGGDLSGQTSQKLLAASADQNLYSSHMYGNQYGRVSHSQDDCDDEGHLRQRRSYNIDQSDQQQMYRANQEEFSQQSMDGWTSDLSQQASQSENLEDLGQQTQDQWSNLENLGQQTQDQWGNLESLGQQTQNKWDNLESLNQHPSSVFEELGQQPQSQLGNLEDLGQQTQNTWDNLESLNQHPSSGLEEIGQQPQSQLSNLEDLGQQTQNTWDNLESLNQHPSNGFEELGQKPQSQLSNLEDLGQQTQNKWDNMGNLNQHLAGGFDELGQQTQSQWGNLESFGQQTQNQWGKLEELGQSNNPQAHNTWNRIEDKESRNLEEQTQGDYFQQNQNFKEDLDQTKFSHFMQSQNDIWNKISNLESQQNMQNSNEYQFNNEHSQVNVGQENSFLHIEQSHSNWDENKEAFSQGSSPWVDLFQDINSNHATDDEKKPISNEGQNFWDAIDKLISESDKKNDSIDNSQYLNSNNFSQEKEENQNINNNYQTHIYHEDNFEQSKEILSEKSKNQSIETHKNVESNLNSDKITENNESNGKENSGPTDKPEDKITIHHINSPVDVGRGDIGPDEIPATSIETSAQHNDEIRENSDMNLNANKLYKTQKEIESLSSIHLNEDVNNSNQNQEPVILNVIGLEKQQELLTTSTRKPRVDYYNSNSDLINEQTISKEYQIPNNISPSKLEIEPKYEEQNSDMQILESIEQQNFEQMLVDLEQQTSNMQDQTLLDFGQQQQTHFSENVQLHSQQEVNNYNTDLQSENEDIEKQILNNDHNKDTIDENQKSINSVTNLNAIPIKQDMILEPIEPTEKPGFWKSAWSKAVSAKASVISWFSSSDKTSNK